MNAAPPEAIWYERPMINELISSVLKSGPGVELLKEVQAKGLSPEQAHSALAATAEGAMQQGGEGGLASLAQGLLSGASSGGLASLAGSMLGGGSAPAAGGLTAMVPGIAQFVATKTGLDPAMAQTIVAMALPKVLEMVKNHTDGAPTATDGGGLGGALKGLLG